MKYIPLLLLTHLLALSLLHADENYLGTLGISTTQKILNDKYCQKIKNKEILCMEYQLEYPDVIKSKDPMLTKMIQQAIQPYRDIFTPNRAKKYIIEDTLQKDDYYASGRWSDETILELFSTTTKTFTLNITNRSYTGGAHGNFATDFENYNIENGQKITLKDLLVPGYEKKLTKIAQDYYKKLHNLTPNESLRQLGWFEDKFILSDTFAITTEGLYFLYNPYEIKAYVFGQTTFLLPYDKLTSLIKKNSIIAPLLSKTNHTIHREFQDSYQADISVDIKPVGHRILEMKLLDPKGARYLHSSKFNCPV